MACKYIGVFILQVQWVNSTIVDIPGVGVVLGKRSENNDVEEFLGVPYAEAPVGELRWRPPRPHRGWVIRKAMEWAPGCVQPQHSYMQPNAGPMDEDCLYLNIARPVAAKGNPVMFWIHGGGNFAGSPFLYPLSTLVASSASSVLAVSAAYRLNIFGYLGSAEMQSLSEDGCTGNFGLQDQRFALQWVQKNIGAFGGDATAVTIFGESSGAASVGWHLTHPESYGLYSKAIMESFGSPAQTLEVAEANYEQVLNATACADLRCLRSVNVDSLVGFVNTLSWSAWGPVTDLKCTMALPSDLMLRGQVNTAANILMGSNRDEYAFFVYPTKYNPGVSLNLSEAEFKAMFPSLYPDFSSGQQQQLLELYAPENYSYPANLGEASQWWWTMMATQTDSSTLGHCFQRRLARALKSAGTEQVFVYLFAHERQYPASDYLADDFPMMKLGNVLVPHLVEPDYVFGAAPASMPDEVDVAKRTSASWASFAATGHPSHAAHAVPGWPAYATKDDVIMRIDATPGAQTGFRKYACDFWDDAQEAFVV